MKSAFETKPSVSRSPREKSLGVTLEWWTLEWWTLEWWTLEYSGRGEDGLRRLMSLKQTTRRQLFGTCGIGLGKVALASLLAQEFGSAAATAAFRGTRGLHHPPRAKRVIYLFMAGAPVSWTCSITSPS